MARLLSETRQSGLRAELSSVVEYRKSGLSLNHIIGCPLDCAYCVRHLFDNFALKRPTALMEDAHAVDALVTHPHFIKDVTPLHLLNRATDPFLPSVKPHLFRLISALDELGCHNHVLVITRYRVTEADCAMLNAMRNVRVSLLLTYSGIEDAAIEPVDSRIAADSLRRAYELAERYRVILYWRPLIEGLNDNDEHIASARALSLCAHATVFSGLFYRDEMRTHYRAAALSEPYNETHRRKILSRTLEARVLAAFKAAGSGPLFRKTSCAVAYAHRMPDYNGHVGIRSICDICPPSQLQRCDAAFVAPDKYQFRMAVEALGGAVQHFDRYHATVSGLHESQRYSLQHRFGFQVHGAGHPHRPHQHGRADHGWP